MDIISAIEFDKSGDHLATGDKGGRVVLFERTDVRDVSTTYLNFVFILIFSLMKLLYQQNASWRELERQDVPVTRHPEFRYKTEFQSHEPEVCY